MRAVRAVVAGVFALGVAAACTEGAGSGSTSGPVTPVPPGASGSTCVGAGPACADSAAVTSFGACVFVECQSAYAGCFGASFASGTYVGDCAGFAACVNACSACDATCVASCQSKHESTACATCVSQQIQSCISTAVSNGKCTAPCASDAGADAAVSDGSCDALATCCGMVPSVDQATCGAAYQSAAGADAQCAEALGVYRGQGKCL
jgi:hypothetical protein